MYPVHFELILGGKLKFSQVINNVKTLGKQLGILKDDEDEEEEEQY